MSNTTGSSTTGPGDDDHGLTPRPAADPWPHEHGEHPSGVSVPEGYGRRSAQERRGNLLGEPQVVDGRGRRGRALAWLAVVALLAIAIVALLASTPW